MTLASYGNLESLTNPPGGVGGQAGAVAYVEAIDGLHQTAYGLLKKIGVAQSMVAKTFSHVGGQTDVGAGEPVFAMDVAIMNFTNRSILPSFCVAIISDELSHGPRFDGG